MSQHARYALATVQLFGRDAHLNLSGRRNLAFRQLASVDPINKDNFLAIKRYFRKQFFFEGTQHEHQK